MGYGRGYIYPHDHPGHWAAQQYLPDGVEGPFYRPSDQGYEQKHQTRLEARRQPRSESPDEPEQT
jgi:putative ATPase